MTKVAVCKILFVWMVVCLPGCGASGTASSAPPGVPAVHGRTETPGEENRSSVSGPTDSKSSDTELLDTFTQKATQKSDVPVDCVTALNSAANIPKAQLAPVGEKFSLAFANVGSDREQELFEAAARMFNVKLPLPQTDWCLGEGVTPSASFSADGRIALIEGRHGCVVFDTMGEHPIGFFSDAHLNWPDSHFVTPDGTHIVSRYPEELVIRAVKELRVIARISANMDTAHAIVGSDTLVYTQPKKEAPYDELVAVSIRTGKTQRIFSFEGTPIIGKRLRFTAISRDKKAAQLVDEETEWHGARILKVVPIADIVAAIWDDEAVSFHQLPTGRLVAAFETAGSYRIATNPVPPLTAVEVCHDNDEHKLCHDTKQVAILDINRQKVITIPEPSPYSMAFSGDGALVAMGGSLVARVYNVKKGKFLFETEPVREEIPCDNDVDLNPCAFDYYGYGVMLHTLPGRRWILETEDESMALVNANNRILHRLNRCGDHLIEGGTLYIEEATPEGAMLSIYKNGERTTRPLTPDEKEQNVIWPEAAHSEVARQHEIISNVIEKTCYYRGFFLPKKYCVPTGTTRDAKPVTEPFSGFGIQTPWVSEGYDSCSH